MSTTPASASEMHIVEITPAEINTIVTEHPALTSLPVEKNTSVTEHPALTSLKKSLAHVSSDPSEVCIYRVPENIRKFKPDSYSPTFISIGPFHAHRNDLISNSLKPEYLQIFLDYYNVTIEQVFETILPLEDKARKFYASPIALSSDEFTELLVLDSCFIFTYIFKVRQTNILPQDIFKVRQTRLLSQPNSLWKQFREDITSDLLLLENQLPFFVLSSLQKLIAKNTNEQWLATLIHGFLVQSEPNVSISTTPPDFFHIGNHLLDFQRLRLCPHKLSCAITDDSPCFPLTVTELHKCGVSFQLNKTPFVLDVSFEDCNGSLKLPQLIIHKGFETQMMNLIAYEHCHRLDHQSEVGKFALFMQFLVKTDEDVELLIKNGVIQNNLSTVNEVTQIFNKLARHIMIDNENVSYYGECKRMMEFCQRRRHRWLTSLKDNYFSSPWVGTATIGAIIVVFLTLVQTIASIISLKE